MSASQQQLTVTIASPFPFALARVGIDAGQDRLVQPVNMSLVIHRTVEFVLHVNVLPDELGSEPVTGASHFDYRRAVAIACGDKDAIFADDEGLGDGLSPSSNAVAKK